MLKLSTPVLATDARENKVFSQFNYNAIEKGEIYKI